MAHFTTSVHRGKGQMPNWSARSEAVQAHPNKNYAGLVYFELEGRITVDYSEPVFRRCFVDLGVYTLVRRAKLSQSYRGVAKSLLLECFSEIFRLNIIRL